MQDHIIHLTNPAEAWNNATPVGNGSAGMMVHGGVACDKITLNEESVWGNDPAIPSYNGMPEKIASLRRRCTFGYIYLSRRLRFESVRSTACNLAFVKNYTITLLF